MADVFISYDEDSAESVARQIAETLEADGISCWYVGRDMEKGALRGVITEAIEDCRVFLLILNEKAIKSAYVQTETALAFRRMERNEKVALRLFRVEDCSLKGSAIEYYLISQDIIDGCPPDAEHIQALAPILDRLLKA